MAKFQPGNTASKGHGRPPGSGFTAELREAIGKDDFKDLVQTIMQQAKAGDMQAASLILSRLAPPLRAMSEAVKLAIPDGSSIEEQAQAVLKALTAGDIPPADAKTVMDVISQAAQLGQLAELERRITELEQRK